ncbi:receptor-like protein kinase feronia [Quercus suber]|uniref:Receptor-like protein kinase feronia n=1 Tax=Quercus suber TaxID=58331 RepID=A0AAW0L7Q3_QUESU
MPDIYSSTDGTLMIVGQNAPFYIDNSTALENVYQLNMGGNDISPSHDTKVFELLQLLHMTYSSTTTKHGPDNLVLRADIMTQIKH